MKERLHLQIRGVVQGVGFRPFVYQLATELGLTGWVNNSAKGVSIEVEGERSRLENFSYRLKTELPPRSEIHSSVSSWLAPVGDREFTIAASSGGEKTALILPDLATCDRCLQEIFAPTNRRYLYPFTNCTHCGPRFSIIETLPYDRPNTTMKQFEMCDRCLAEYRDPRDRRFHAQPNACPQCGPHLELWNWEGRVLNSHHDALLATAEAVRQGKIVAVKGLGGFHLIIDAGNEAAVGRLRDRKRRPDKSFALMYPNLELVKADCQVSILEEKLLLSPEAPIVLLKTQVNFFEQVAPQNPYLGIMLPYTPLHHLLMKELGFPVVATSGNLSDEPICIGNREALTRLDRIADLFLVHNRPIVRPVDDSIARLMGGRGQIIRRARGYAPLPIKIALPPERTLPSPILAVGAQLKNAIAFGRDDGIFISQYIGDLETVATFDRFQQTISDFQQLYELQPTKVACDLHPDYLSTQYAQQSNIALTSVQHHYAHLLSCMADNELDLNQPTLGIVWDGTGYGLDGTIWGGEFLSLIVTGFRRIAHLRRFQLPGGERAIREPKRIAIALLYEIFGDRLFTESDNFDYLPCFRASSSSELNILRRMLNQKINTPITSSMGRLFDGIASLLGIRQQISYEGQAAMELEFAIAGDRTDSTYDFELIQPQDQTINLPIVIDWEKLVIQILKDLTNHVSSAEISAKFHNTLAEIIVSVTRQAALKQIVLTGGCWQNKYLTEKAIARLRQADCIPYWHRRIPSNDGGIAVGQILAALRNLD